MHLRKPALGLGVEIARREVRRIGPATMRVPGSLTRPVLVVLLTVSAPTRQEEPSSQNETLKIALWGSEKTHPSYSCNCKIRSPTHRLGGMTYAKQDSSPIVDRVLRCTHFDNSRIRSARFGLPGGR